MLTSKSFSVIYKPVWLFPKTELLNQGTIAGEVVLAEVCEQTFTLTYHFHQPTVGAEIFLIGFQVSGQGRDALCKQGYLPFN